MNVDEGRKQTFRWQRDDLIASSGNPKWAGVSGGKWIGCSLALRDCGIQARTENRALRTNDAIDPELGRSINLLIAGDRRETRIVRGLRFVWDG